MLLLWGVMQEQFKASPSRSMGAGKRVGSGAGTFFHGKNVFSVTTTFPVPMLTSIRKMLNMGQTLQAKYLGCSETVQGRHSAEALAQRESTSATTVIAL